MEPTTLEIQAQGELNDPRIQSSGYLAKVPGAEIGRNRLEARVIPDVEKFRAELELDPFTDGKRFVESPIPGIFRRAPDQAGPAVPNVPNAGGAKAAVLNHCETFLGPDTLPVQLGRVANALVPVAMPGVKANPLSITVIPENVQPPSIFPAKSLRCLKTGRL